MAELGVAETVVPVVAVVAAVPAVCVPELKLKPVRIYWMSVARIWVWRPLVVTADGSASVSDPVRCSRAWSTTRKFGSVMMPVMVASAGPVLRRPLVSCWSVAAP